MSEDKKYPIAATCKECKEDVWVNKGKDSGKEYLTDSKNVRGEKPKFHGCFQSKWLPREVVSMEPETRFERVDSQKVEAKVPVDSKPIVTQISNELLREKLAEEAEEFETADARMDFDRTYKLVELSISKTRKVNEKTIPQIHQYESLDYFINAKIECEINANFQKIVREKFADIQVAIDKEIEQDRIRLEGLKSQ